MSKSTVRAIFTTHANAADALETLISQGVSPKQVSVIGKDSDAFRQATSVLQAKRLDRLIIGLGYLGFIVGAFAGLLGLPSFTLASSPAPSTIMSGLMGSFSGALLGLLTGSYIGGILHLDNRPTTDATIRMGEVSGGVMAVFIQAQDEAELEVAKSAALGNAASNLCINFK